MRKILLSAAMIGLISGASLALAQDHEHGGGPRGEGRGGTQGEGRGGNAHAEPGGRPAMSGPGEHRDAPAPNAMRTQDRGPGNDRNAIRGPSPDNRGRPDFNRPENRTGNAMRGPSPDNRGGPDFNRSNNRPNEAVRGPGPQRDFSGARNFHQNFQAERRFHVSAYRRPAGWYSHHWRWGEFLPVAFWPRDYWIVDFVDYDLPPPPFGAVWVRVGDDALLIDRYTGEIIEVDYGVFY